MSGSTPAPRGAHDPPPSVVLCRFPATYPVEVTYTVLWPGSCGSNVIRLQYRAGSPPPTGAQDGAVAVAFADRSTDPAWVPTQTTFEFPGATAIALISPDPGGLIAFQ